uniref:Drebrin n=1 Tax=Neogobius melanostomus TaxID=47308 RepID=A0A8C6TNY7_9GOBI
MSTQTVNLDTYSLSLLTAKEDIFNPRSSTDWALFVYDGISNKLKLADSGVGGVAELASKFHISKPQYGLCRIRSPDSGSPRTAMIIWVGQNVDDFRRTECANHIPAIKNFFKEAQVFLKAEKPEEVTEERIRAELSNAHTNSSTQWLRRSSRSMDREEIVGTNYRKTNAAMEMRLVNRDSFWARAEREEEERKEEERKKAAEERRRIERERAMKERQDAEERDRKMNDKLKTIEEQRRQAAEQEEEERRKEKLKWEVQQREHEDEMRARLKRSESIEKAAVSPCHPDLRSQSSKPFRRYQRSLTDTAFIFSKAEESAASAPPPPSPFNRAVSPPTSPVFYSSTSPQRTPLSPPLSPLRPTPPTSALPSIPATNLQMKGRAKSPTGPSAPPASPTQLGSSEGGAPGSPPNLVSEISYKVQTVLVEEDEEEEEEEEEEAEKEEEDVKEKEDSQPRTESEPQADPPEPEEGEALNNEAQIQLKQEEAIEDEDFEKDKPQPEETPAVEEKHQTEEWSEDEQEAMEKKEDDNTVEEEPEQIEEAETMEVESVTETPENPQWQVHEEMITEEQPDQNYLSPTEPYLLTQHEEVLVITGMLSMICDSSTCYFVFLLHVEDDSELSFELGDIIIDVEAVDKGWWRGYSQDGRQGLFPANYVETISPQ